MVVIDHPTSDDDAGAFLRAAPDAIIAVDHNGNITLANPASGTLFGVDETTLIGQNVDSLVPDEHRSLHRANRTRYNAAPRVRPMADPSSRLKARHASGRLIPVEISLSPLQVNGEERVMAIIRDVTARQLAEAEQETIRQSLDAVDDAVFMFAPDTLEFSYANVGAVHQTGYSREELTGGMTPLHIKPEMTAQTFGDLVRPLLDGAMTATTFETIHRRKDGVDVPVEISLTYPSVVNESTRPIVALVRDISDRRQAEARLQRSELAFRSAFEDAPVPMAMADLSDPTNRPIVAVNAAFAALLGRSANELIGTTVAAITHPDDLERDMSQASGLVDEGARYGVEKRYQRADGSYVWGELHVALATNADGRPTSIAHIVDISRRVEAEEERDRREGLLAILADIREEVLQEAGLEPVLELIAESTCIWTSATYAGVIIPSATGELECRAIHSHDHGGEVGRQLPPGSPAERVMASGETLVMTDLQSTISEHSDTTTAPFGLGPAMFVPLVAPNSIEGVLITARPVGSAPFDEHDQATAAALASEAALTITLERARYDRRRMSLVQDRERIARDLHDLVIQQLFATGMNLQSSLDSPRLLQERATEAITGLDETISVIRKSIFELTQEDDSLTGDVQRLVDRHRAIGRNTVDLEIEGDLETLSRPIRNHIVPVLTELLTNVERHANATTAQVLVRVSESMLTLTVSDDGRGMSDTDGNGFGTTNLRNRASAIGGDVRWEVGKNNGGTRVIWTAPLA